MTNACDCPKCRACCENIPGWFNPQEAARAMKFNNGSKLMLDYFPDEDEPDGKVWALMPAIHGYERTEAPEHEIEYALAGGCIFLQEGKCALHDSGYKPYECRVSFACKGPQDFRYRLAVLKKWKGKRARALIAKWREDYLKPRKRGGMRDAVLGLALVTQLIENLE